MNPLDEFGWNRNALGRLIGFGNTTHNGSDKLFFHQLRKFTNRTQSRI